MGFTSYITINGKIHGQVKDGEVTGFATDALGSVTATVDSSGNVSNTYRNKPYGALLAKTGTGLDPTFQWVGSYGYRATGRAYCESYVRARHYGYVTGVWTSIDPLWPSESAYQYSTASPTSYIDPCGMSVSVPSIIPRPRRSPERHTSAECRSYNAPEVVAAMRKIHPNLDAKLRWYIEHDACCLELAESKVHCQAALGYPEVPVPQQFDPLFNRNYIKQQLYDLIYKSLVCSMCIESAGFDKYECFHRHRSSEGTKDTPSGMFGFNEPTKHTYNIKDLKLETQLREGVRLFCREVCKRRGGCSCEKAVPGMAGLPYPEPNSLDPDWPSNRWPYMPGPSSDPNKQKWLDCVFGKGQYTHGGIKPPVAW